MLQGIIELGEIVTRKFFEHRMSTYAAALAYRGLFGLFPFVLILVVLAGVMGLSAFVDRMDEQTTSESSRQVPRQLEPAVERGREQIQPLERMIEQAEERARGELLIFGVAVALWSTSALARTLTEAFNAAYEIAETRPGWKRFALSWTFGPILALVVVVSVGLMLIGPRLVERIAEVVGLDEVFVSLWGWLDRRRLWVSGRFRDRRRRYSGGTERETAAQWSERQKRRIGRRRRPALRRTA
jgi:membrane protein